SLADLAASFGEERPAVVARELTKIHETVYRGTLGELARLAREDPNFRRGEITLVVQGAAGRQAHRGADPDLLRRAVQLLAKELPPSRAAAVAAQLTGVTRSEAYALVKQLV